ncbi:MAG: hypothetical protein IPP40_04525 [bacterium]|nr:hypothetical protein [bacterium]
MTVELDVRHTALQVDLVSLGVMHHDATAVTQAENAPTFAVVSANLQAIALTGPSTTRDFPVVLDPNDTSGIVYVVGLDPDATENDGTPTASSTSKFIASKSVRDSAVADPGDADDPLPTDVVVRKKRIPVPQGTGQISSTGIIVLVTLAAFIAGYSLAVLLN